MKNLILFVAGFLLWSVPLFAETGLLQGWVSNQSGAVLSNARITLADGDKNVVIQGTTGPTGRFSLNVPLGEYELNINADGFGRWRQLVRVVPGVLYFSVTVVPLPDGIDVRSDALPSNANLDAIVLNESFLRTLSDHDSEFAISLAGTRVTGRPGMTQVSSPLSGVGGGVGTGAFILNGPPFGGGAPSGAGVTGGIGGFPGGGFGPGMSGAAAFLPVLGSFPLASASVVGQPRLSGPQVNLTGPEFIVDGQSGRLPPKDQVREVWIASDPFTAEYSRPGFGRVHVNSLLATREIHGSASFNFRDEAMDSPTPSFFVFRRPYQSRYLHGEVGGPLIREKLFGSLAVQRLGQDSGRTLVAAVTPSGLVNSEISNGSADQIFNGRSQYQISERHKLNVNGRYRSQIFPNLGVGGTSLPEQATPMTNRGWDLQIREMSRLGSNVVHEARAQFRRDTTEMEPLNEGTTIHVFGSFIGGGTSSRSAYRDTQAQLENLVVLSTPEATLRMGVQGYHIRRITQFTGQRLGQFDFPSLSDYLAGRPVSYSQSLASGSQDVRQTEGSVFAQAEWYASPQFSLSGGLRYEAQTNLDDHNNIDPRIAFAYRMVPKIVLRGGLGIFHQRLTIDDASVLENANGRILPSFIRVANPSYPNPDLTAGTTFGANSSFALRDPNLAAPYLEVGSLSLEKWFDRGYLISATGNFIRGMRQFRTRNLAAPYLRDVDPATLTADEVNQRRPFYPLAGFINQYESVGFLESKNLSLRGRTPELRVWKIGMQFNGDYTLNWTEDDDGIPVDNYDRRAEWGRTSLTPRHNFWSGAMFRVPWRISLAALAHAHDGYPWTTTQSADLNRDGNFNDRPAGVRKNSNDGPNYFNLDLKLSKSISLPRVEATLFAYGQNVFNSRNYTVFGSSTSIGGGLFLGNASTRRMELGVRLQF
jgi:hypothetical protein